MPWTSRKPRLPFLALLSLADTNSLPKRKQRKVIREDGSTHRQIRGCVCLSWSALAAVRLAAARLCHVRPLGFRWQPLALGAVDASLATAALLIALWVRFDDGIPPQYLALSLHATWIVIPLTVLCFAGCGLYNRIWEYAGMEAAAAVIVGASASVGTSCLAAGVLLGQYFPRSVSVIWWLLLLGLMGGSRFAWRVLRQRIYGRHGMPPRKRLLIYGAGDAGRTLTVQVTADRHSPYEVVGFVDDDPLKQRLLLGRHPVLGMGRDVARIVQERQVDEIIIAIPSATAQQRSEMFRICSQAGVRVRTLPRLLELVRDPLTLSSVRDVRISELLGRDVRLPAMSLNDNYVQDKVVLVTGAGGSIGAEVCRQLCTHRPRRLVLLGRGENRIHKILNELSYRFPDIELTPVIANFADPGSCEVTFDAHRPDIVVHAGAHKHVYLMESNPVEAVRNNVLGTQVVAQCAEDCGAERLLFISTDKAAEPCNVMGATKRFCEVMLQERAENSKTCYTVVRFGNVIGSDGSVLRIFEEQLAAGQPLTVTHPEADRYFMTISEAAFLVLQAATLGASGDIFVLDMGEPVRILHLARNFIGLHGRNPYAPDAVHFIGLRPGEKLHETLTNDGEQLTHTACPWVWKVRSTGNLRHNGNFSQWVELMQELVAENDALRLQEVLFTAISPATVAVAAPEHDQLQSAGG